jgi:hypothetical protein
MSASIPTPITLSRFRGDTEAVTIHLKDTAGAAIDITGYSCLLTVSKSKAPSDPTGQVGQSSGALTDPTAGEVTFAVQAGGLADLPPGTYFWDAQYTTPQSVIRTFAHGTWKVTQDITK